MERCLTCRMIKVEHQRSNEKLQPLEVPRWKWERITMDFMTKLHRTTKGFDAIWVIVDRLTKSANFLVVRESYGIYEAIVTTTFKLELGREMMACLHTLHVWRYL